MSKWHQHENYSVPFVIRNLTPHGWPRLIMRLCFVVALICCFLGFTLIKLRAPRIVALLPLFPALLGIIGAVLFAFVHLGSRRVDKLVLGDRLETRPRKSRFEHSNVQRIELVTTLEDDHVNLENATIPLRVRISLYQGSGIRLIRLTLSDRDAKRLVDWAKHHDIPLGTVEFEA